MALNQQQLQDGLNNHERNLRISEIPYFHGNAAKDTYSARAFIQRIESAAETCTWNEERKCSQLLCSLKGAAYEWIIQAKEVHGVNHKDWATIKAYFLETFDTQKTAKSYNNELRELLQKTGESVRNFAIRCDSAFGRDLTDGKTKLREHDVAFPNANDAATIAAIESHANKIVFNCYQRIQMSFFQSGLREAIRKEVVKDEYDTVRECVKAAMRVEAQLESEHLTRKFQVSQLDEVEETGGACAMPEDDGMADLDDEEFDSICAMYQRRNKPIPSRFKKRFQARSGFRNGNGRTNGNGNGNGNGSRISSERKKEMDCWHCGKKGHVISECFSKKAGKPKDPSAGRNRQAAHAVDEQVYRVNDISRQQSLNS